MLSLGINFMETVLGRNVQKSLDSPIYVSSVDPYVTPCKSDLG